MKKFLAVFAVLALAMICAAPSAVADPHRLGGGVHYWKTIDDIDFDNYDDNGYTMLVSYQYKPTLIGCELDLEFSNQDFGGSSESVLSPQAYFILGGLIYGGLGIGSYYVDSDWSDPFYALKLGVDFELAQLHFDINANYRFDEWDYDTVADDVDTDKITLGLVVRYEFD